MSLNCRAMAFIQLPIGAPSYSLDLIKLSISLEVITLQRLYMPYLAKQYYADDNKTVIATMLSGTLLLIEE